MLVSGVDEHISIECQATIVVQFSFITQGHLMMTFDKRALIVTTVGCNMVILAIDGANHC